MDKDKIIPDLQDLNENGYPPMGYIDKSEYALQKMSKTALIKRMLYLQRLLIRAIDEGPKRKKNIPAKMKGGAS